MPPRKAGEGNAANAGDAEGPRRELVQEKPRDTRCLDFTGARSLPAPAVAPGRASALFGQRPFSLARAAAPGAGAGA
ncbi:hypothetical protein [Paeniglutamicibacter cryotolerans]|uniref:Uncharacterized protein n=1 Tax=Paeniglutamicibacter cryotolerans TaxID=670079 RepID=A0A839QSA1_9MICC|nr:hypothetical protein [Paeniglutamicibacter cryotolerans]MBB2996836.1 hypothetical protein [Paeniglutamicibacter cryotolerans]